MSCLFVRSLERNDLQTRVDWFNTPLVYRQMTIEVPMSLANTNKWFTDTVMNDARRDLSFLLREDDHERLVAMGGLVDINARHRRAELYIIVNPTMTGQGIGRKCIQWLCNFGFIQLNLFRIYLYSLADNEGARRLYARLGFVQEGKLRKHVYHSGRFVDRYVQGLLREDWEKQPWHISAPLFLQIHD
jgi:diamine N-acetyltransferase